MGLLGDEASVADASFVALCPRLATGVALCELVTAIEGVPVVGVFRNPRSLKTAEANARRACERLARHKNMSRRFLFRADDVAAGVPGVLLGLLEDIRVFHDGKPPRVDGSKKWDPRVPYCPDEDPEDACAHSTPAVHTLPTRFAAPVPPSLRAFGKAGGCASAEAPRAAGTDAAASADVDADSGNDSDTSLRLAYESSGGSAEPSPVAGGPTRVVASVEPSGQIDHPAKNLRAAPLSPRLADAPEEAARAAAAALEGWRDGVAKDLEGVDDASDSRRFTPTISDTPGAFGSISREHAWERGSFPRTRATPAETARREAIESAARAARTVVDAYRPKPLSPARAAFGASGPRELSTAARARAAERARKKAASAHAEAEKKTRAADFGGSASPTRPTTSFRSSASREPETVSKPRRRPPRPPTQRRSFSSENEPPSFAAPHPSPPRSPRPGTGAKASPNAAHRPLRRVPPPSPEARRREERERDAIRAARWIESLGVSTRRSGASGASSRSGRRRGDPFADATRAPAAELAAVCADGTLLCELVRVLEKRELAGVTWRPASNASRAHNVGKALAAMRQQPAMSPMHLWCEKDIVAADEEAVLGLLGDMRACAAYRRAGRR